MQWQIIVALVIAIPVLLIPVILVWYLKIADISRAVKEAEAKKVIRKDKIKSATKSV